MSPVAEKSLARKRPPFRADMVGSLLRTATLRDARARHEKGEISADALRDVEDAEIRKIVKRQESLLVGGPAPSSDNG